MAAQKVTKLSLAEIYKRVPPNQIHKFLHFRDKNAQYKKRVNKHPEFLPKIDWEYYRCNVRTEYIKMVEDFEKKYEELNKIFDCRHQLDTKSYFKELDEQRMAVKSEVEAYIVESNKRIKAYEEEIKRIKGMIPYEQMTCEEFVMARPDKAHLIGCGEQPSFWPHIPEEQTPGPANPQAHEALEKLLETGEPEPEPETTPPQKEAPPPAVVDSKAAAMPPAGPITAVKSTAKAKEKRYVTEEEAKKAAAAAEKAKKIAAEIEQAKVAAKEAAKSAAVKEVEKAAATEDAAKKAASKESKKHKADSDSSKPTKSDSSSSTSKETNPKDKGKK